MSVAQGFDVLEVRLSMMLTDSPGTKCSKCFNIEYALILEDDEGDRAGPVLEEPDVPVF